MARSRLLLICPRTASAPSFFLFARTTTTSETHVRTGSKHTGIWHQHKTRCRAVQHFISRTLVDLFPFFVVTTLYIVSARSAKHRFLKSSM